MIELKLTVSDIPKERIFVGKKGKYIDLVCVEMQKPDDYGNTHTVYLRQTKEEYAAKSPKIYIGKGKEKVFNNETSSKAEPKQNYTPPTQKEDPGAAFENVTIEESDLPF